MRKLFTVPSSRLRGQGQGEGPSLAPYLVFLLLLATTASAQRPVAVVLPLSNVSGAAEAAAPVERAIAEALERRGWTVAAGEEVESFLEEQRIRYLDSLPSTALAAIRERMGASAIVLGSILAYRENGNAVVALAGRMLDPKGTVLWAEVAAISSSESEGALGFGRRMSVDALGKDAAAQLLRNVPRPGESRIGSLKSGFLTGAVTYRSGSHPRGEVRRVCVLPFASSVPEASRVLLEILTVRLEATGEFDVVEPAAFRDAMRAEKLRSVAAMTSTELAALGKHLGTTIFLRGNVHAWREAPGGRSEIQLDMTLADVATGEILWAVTHQRRGSDYAGLLQRGTIDNVISLADRTVSETISAQHRARPRAREARKEK